MDSGKERITNMFDINNLSISLQPFGDDRDAILKLAKDKNFGIEVVDFCMLATLNNKKVYEDLLELSKSELSGFSKLSFHGPFIDILLHSPDNEIAAISRSKIETAIATAHELKCTTLVFHTGINTLIRHQGYVDNSIRTHINYWSQILKMHPDVTICLENMWEQKPTILKRIIEGVNNKRMRICFDTGHANIFSTDPLETWLADIGDKISHMHWNDNFGEIDTENAVGDGNIDWKNLIRKIDLMDIFATIVLEVGSVENILRSLDYLMHRPWQS